MGALGLLILLPYRNFLSDDGFIYLRFIRNFTMSGVFCYNPGVPTYGMTSPLWVLVVSAVNILVNDAYISSKIVSFLLSTVAIVAYYHFVSLFLRRPTYCVIATLALILDPWFAKWSTSGLENPLTLSVLFSCLYFYFRARNTPSISYWSYVLSGVGVLCRPELALLLPIICTDIVFFENHQKARKLVAMLLCSMLPICLWAVYAQNQFGTIVPNTILAKRAEAEFRSTHLRTLTRTAAILGGSGFLHLLSVAVFVSVWAATQRIRLCHVRALIERFWVLLGLYVSLPIFYILGKATVSGRYVIPVIPVFTLFGTLALESTSALLRVKRRTELAVALIFGFFLMAQLAVLQGHLTWFVTHWKRGMDPGLIEIAEWLRDNTPRRTIVAGHEIGVLGYFSERRLLDTGGLCSPQFIPFIRAGTTDDLIFRSRPDFLLTSGPLGKGRYDGIATLVLQRKVQREGSGGRGGFGLYCLYRLKFDAEQGGSGAQGAGESMKPRREADSTSEVRTRVDDQREPP